ncbi:YggT family protein [Lusitaniella coriacea]|uniref:YggT family protein n=1 Tax=Lusitaniella coriacea TaxID=1983105 RepID=UPI003CF86FCF
MPDDDNQYQEDIQQEKRRQEQLRQEQLQQERLRQEQLRLQEEERNLATARRREVVVRAIQAIYYLTGALAILLTLRLLLSLFGANPDNQFARVIYALSTPFIAPFNNLFGTPTFDGSVFEINVLVAMGVYALLTWLVVRLIWLIWN